MSLYFKGRLGFVILGSFACWQAPGLYSKERSHRQPPEPAGDGFIGKHRLDLFAPPLPPKAVDGQQVWMRIASLSRVSVWVR
jgi:hypothetical protein